MPSRRRPSPRPSARCSRSRATGCPSQQRARRSQPICTGGYQEPGSAGVGARVGLRRRPPTGTAPPMARSLARGRTFADPAFQDLRVFESP
jgi:hypothetical protein